MESLKIFVGSKSESKEAQELFFELGYSWESPIGRDVKNTEYPILYVFDFGSIYFGELPENAHGTSNHKIITLPELRDMVVLKQNDVGDYTHGSSFGSKFYHCCNGDVYAFNDGKWVFDHTKVLKPIEKKEMKEYLNKKTFEVIKSNDNGYFDFGLDVRDWIEIPVGAVKAYLNNSKTINFVNADDDYMNGVTDGKWIDTHRGKHESCGHVLVWQREIKTEEFKQPEDLPFLDNGVDIGVENLPDFTPEFPSEKEIKTDFPLNRGDINYRAAIAFNAIRGTDLTEEDVHFLRELLNSITNHYGA